MYTEYQTSLLRVEAYSELSAVYAPKIFSAPAEMPSKRFLPGSAPKALVAGSCGHQTMDAWLRSASETWAHAQLLARPLVAEHTPAPRTLPWTDP